MTWVFDYTLPSIIVLLIFLILYFISFTLATRSSRCFFIVVIAEVVGILATLLSSIVDNNYYNHSKALLLILNHAYYIMFTFRYFLYTRYFSTLVHKKNIAVEIINYTVFGIALAFIFTNPFTNYIYSISPTSKFSVGPFIMVIYASNIISVILSLYYVIKGFNDMELKERITLLFVVLILLSSCLVDLFFMNYIISDMFFLVVMSILFFVFENPDTYRDKTNSIFTLQAFKASMKDYIVSHKGYSIFGFFIKNYPELLQIYGSKQMNMMLKEIASYFLANFTNKKMNFYYVFSGRFIIIDKAEKYGINLKNEIKERFKKPWTLKNGTNVLLKIVILDLDKKLEIESYDDLEKTFEEAISNALAFSKNEVVIDSSFYENTLRKTQVLKALHNAIQNDSLDVFLQPLIDTSNGNIIAAEALVRINDNTLGLIPPDEFITMAEENGYIKQLGEQVLNKVCIFLHHLRNKHNLKWINVNLSPIQCLDSNLLETINSIVDKNNVDHSLIHLEITEECIIDLDILKTQMDKLIDNGYKISLDDFGSGFSNLSLIKALPFNNIKLDMSIVRGHFASPDVMLPGIVETFIKKGLSVTAEGIENSEMRETFENMGVTYLQGYCFSKPIPMYEFYDLMQKDCM